MSQESTRAARASRALPGRRSGLTYLSHRKHGVFVSLFPRNYGRFLLIGLTGKAMLLLVLACGFVIAAAVAAGREDQALFYGVPLVGIGFAAYELFADLQVRLFNRTFRPIRPAGVALLVLALSGVWLVTFPIASAVDHRSSGVRLSILPR